MIGDHDRDIESGISAGCKSIKITSKNTLDDIVDDILKT
jgi:phosphoglycolate phosphatase-like HAD superfamily hydrolase